jgi:hypothetical protein
MTHVLIVIKYEGFTKEYQSVPLDFLIVTPSISLKCKCVFSITEVPTPHQLSS